VAAARTAMTTTAVSVVTLNTISLSAAPDFLA
jgi:hypothetical protein